MFDPDTHVPKRSREEWRKRAKRCDVALLTPLQLAIDNLYCENMKEWRIAIELGTTEGVVKAQLTRIDKKRRGIAPRKKPNRDPKVQHDSDEQMLRTLNDMFGKPLHYEREAEQLRKVRRAILDAVPGRKPKKPMPTIQEIRKRAAERRKAKLEKEERKKQRKLAQLASIQAIKAKRNAT